MQEKLQQTKQDRLRMILEQFLSTMPPSIQLIARPFMTRLDNMGEGDIDSILTHIKTLINYVEKGEE